MESYIYNNNKMSIKDSEGDINVNLSKWDSIFGFLLEKTSAIYFCATRLEFMDGNLENNIDLLVDQNFKLVEDDYFRVAFKIKKISILMGRGLVNDVWKRYEYAAIIFVKKELEHHDFKRIFHAKYYDDIFSFVEGMYVVYKNVEADVLWIEKTMDMEFPQLP